jgi:hypothetical protein
MAKKLVKNYVFTPGVGIDENLLPNAYSLISQNRQFIIKEVVAFIQNQVDGAEKCERDLLYILNGVRYDVALGTNYNAIFLGLAEFNSQDISETVIRNINRTKAAVLGISAVDASVTAETRVNAFYNEVIDIATNGRSAANALSFPNPSDATASEIAAKDRLVANRNFLAAEVNAWVAVNYPGADHDADKCSRDVKYAIDALCYDILYGGNSATYDQAKFFFYSFADGSPGIDPTHRLQTVAAYNRLQTIVGQVVRGETVTKSTGNALNQDTSGSNADSSDATILENLVQITEDVVNAEDQDAADLVLDGITRTAPSYSFADAGIISAADAIATNASTIVTAAVGYTGYTYNASKCERDTGYVVDALLHDLRYGGNEQIHFVASQYWDGTVPQIDGNRFAEYDAYIFLQDLINLYLLTNTEDQNPEQEIEQQVIDLTKTSEAGATSRVTTLLTVVVNVIQNGLGSLPALDIRLGRVEVLGKIELEDLLLISNVTDNIVIYNFAEPTKGGTVEFNEGNSPSYPNALSVNNGTTIIRFKFDTSAMSSTDSIQVFLENTELKVRPYDFGTDAIERMRVAQPQAMLDADFEYGLQPTKWQAIGTQRGYPATYEISASDIPVENITTDASSGSSGVGASRITVTTSGAHGLSQGEPFTLRALASSITGFARAEGTFIVFDVPTPTTFRYYAKAKVGSTAGQILATSTSQLRRAGFYTGASIGEPSFAVFSNGSSGSFATTLRTLSGSNTLPFNGSAPPIGAPLSGTGIATGTQVTGVFGPSNSDGIVDYKFVKTTYLAGATSIELVDVINLQSGMAVGTEGSPDTLVEVTSIVGTTLNLSDEVEVGHLGDESTYTGSLVGVVGDGLDLYLDIDVTAGVYSVVGIGGSGGGTGFKQGDTVFITGDQLGGTAPVNNLTLNVDSVSGGVVTAVSIIEGTGTGTGSFTDVEAFTTAPLGTGGGNFEITRTLGGYLLDSFPTTGSSNYYVGNQYKLTGDNIDGVTPDNDVIITVTAVNGTELADAEISGTASRGDQIPVYATVTISENTTANIAATTAISYSAIATIQVTWPKPHGIVPGSGINVSITSGGLNHELAGGPFSAEAVTSPQSIRYTARAPGTIDSATALEGSVYMRPDTFFTHRPFDGGVQLGTGGPQHGGQAIRQSKKYIRYQSGKGAMYNTGALFAPSFDLRSITADSTASGSTITVVTDDVDHGVQAGAVIRISNVDTTGYNGDYTVSEIVDERNFRIIAQTQLGSTTGTIGSQCQMALLRWHGAVVRSGPFDDQNGIFFQYDGNQLSVGRRSSTLQLAGTIAIEADSNEVTGTNTRFLDQLKEGDRIVIRGMTHVVAGIESNSTMIVTPDFRGVRDISGVKICKIEDLIIPQSEWNLDRCDGTGPSGYNIDTTKMQMIGIQFSWYGAGFIDWMLRGPSGEYVFCHRLKGNNLNTEAYMRTGNGPVRYEVLNEGANSRLVGAMTDEQATIVLEDSKLFPISGVVYIDNELISYSGKNDSTNTLTGCTRAASLTNFAAGAVRTYTAGDAATHNDRQGVVLVSCTTSPIISHWGSAYLIDGNFDSDRGYIFNYAARGVEATTTRQTAFFIRLAPSVSNAVVGDLGERELLNRAQLLLQAISITSDSVEGGGAIVVEGILNPSNYPDNPANIAWNGLQGAAAGGQPSFAQIALGGSVSWGAGATTEDATVQGAVTSSITARAFGTVTQTLTLRTIFGVRSLDRNRQQVYVRQTDVDELTTTLVVGDGLSNASNGAFASNTVISGIQRNWFTTGGITYVLITLDRRPQNDSGSSDITCTVTSSVATTYNSAVRNNRSNILVTDTDWTGSGAIVGDSLSNVSFMTTARQIGSVNTSFTKINNVQYTRINLSGNGSSNSGGNTNITMTITANQTAASYTGTNYLNFTAASWEALGAVLGTAIDATETSFPAGTSVNSITTRTLGATQFYRVGFSQSSNTTINASDLITFTFGAEYALPGEQVFSFIANPGETQTLDLTELKELGTTAIGGRGTFPNGPDTLAINVFKVSGSATNVNIILRWGEAQA